MRKTMMLENGSRDEAYRMFDEVKNSIKDFKKESVGISGDLKNHKTGWNVVKVHY
jgi:hypothetical protein